MQLLMKGFQKNDTIQSLDLTDNEITDIEGMTVLNMIKFQAEKRDNEIWSCGLRN